MSSIRNDGNETLPTILVEGESIARTWERSLIECWNKGVPMSTEYDKPGDPRALACTMIMSVDRALGEPRVHRSFPGSLEDLEIYADEVVDGVHDDRETGYTYHKRLCEYPSSLVLRTGGEDYVLTELNDQIEYIVTDLVRCNHSRRAQATTWIVGEDQGSKHPPCLQRVHCTLTKSYTQARLNMNTHWRSRDAYKAAFMNMYALTHLQSTIADRLSKKLGKPVIVGKYVDISDNYHIYGSYFSDVEGFMDILTKRSFEQRTWTTEQKDELLAPLL